MTFPFQCWGKTVYSFTEKMCNLLALWRCCCNFKYPNFTKSRFASILKFAIDYPNYPGKTLFSKSCWVPVPHILIWNLFTIVSGTQFSWQEPILQKLLHPRTFSKFLAPGNGLVLSGNKPLPEPMLIKFRDAYSVTGDQWVKIRFVWTAFSRSHVLNMNSKVVQPFNLLLVTAFMPGILSTQWKSPHW